MDTCLSPVPRPFVGFDTNPQKLLKEKKVRRKEGKKGRRGDHYLRWTELHCTGSKSLAKVGPNILTRFSFIDLFPLVERTILRLLCRYEGR